MTQSIHEHDYPHEQALEHTARCEGGPGGMMFCDVCQHRDTTDCILWESTEIKCPRCVVSSHPQDEHDVDHVEFLKLKDDTYKCPVCSGQWPGLGDVIGVFIDDVVIGNRVYAKYEELRRNVRNAIKDLEKV